MYVQAKLTPSEYVQHHMFHWQLNLHNFTFTDGGFWTLNLDTLIISVTLGILFFGLFYIIARGATAGFPSKWQNFVEMAVELIDKTVKDSFYSDRSLVAPLALTIFIWVFFDEFYGSSTGRSYSSAISFCQYRAFQGSTYCRSCFDFFYVYYSFYFDRFLQF